MRRKSEGAATPAVRKKLGLVDRRLIEEDAELGDKVGRADDAGAVGGVTFGAVLGVDALACAGGEGWHEAGTSATLVPSRRTVSEKEVE